MLWAWRSQAFLFKFLTTHLHRVAASLNRSGWLVWWLCKTPLRLFSSPFFLLALLMISSQSGSSSGIEKMPRSLAASNLGSPSVYLFVALRCKLCDMFDHCSGQVCPGLVVTCFFVNLPWTHANPSGGFVLSSANRVIQVQGSDSDLPPSILQRSSMGCLMKHVNARFRFSGHHCNSEVSGNRPTEQRALISEQHDSDILWILISGFFLPCLNNVVEIPAWGRSRLCRWR